MLQAADATRPLKGEHNIVAKQLAALTRLIPTLLAQSLEAVIPALGESLVDLWLSLVSCTCSSCSQQQLEKPCGYLHPFASPQWQLLLI